MAVSTDSVAGIIAGRNPLIYESSNPITVFLFQAIFIIGLCQIVHIPLGFIRQPRVIAEVLSGIILGPTALGKIDGFTSTCFPTDSVPQLTLVANIGLILFLFLVGLEVDLKFIKKNIRIALTVGLVNMAIPFGFGCIIAIGLHKEYATEGFKFTTYMVFIAVAMCITAFPVLARILTELRLLKDKIGTIVLAAGITNDVVGWMLLALSITLANAGNGITTLYVLLCVAGYSLFVMYPLRLFLKKIVLKKDLKNGSLSRFSIMMILLLVFFSSFFTDIIGVHSIFGAFLIGLIVPREHGFVVEITNKIEDLVHIVLIPIYFATSGFKADLTQIKTGKDWGYTIALILIAVITKVFGGFISSLSNDLFWRESLTVGVLMSCKGIVEIVVLTVGLNAGIITNKIFSMFIVMMLISTFLTTPMTLFVYPQSYRDEALRIRRLKLNEKSDSDLSKTQEGETSDSINIFDIDTILDKFDNDSFKFNKIIYNIEDIGGFVRLLNFIELFYGTNHKTDHKTDHQILNNHTSGIKPLFNAIFLKQLTERTSDLINASTMHDEEEKRHNNIVQLDLLRRIFEFNEIPYVGDLKYYVGNQKLDVYLENYSDVKNSNDLMIFTLTRDQLTSHPIEVINNYQKTPSLQIGLLITTSGLKARIDSLTVKFETNDHDPNDYEVDSLIIYLTKLFAFNNTYLKRVNVYLEDGQTELSVDKCVKRLKASLNIDVSYVTETSGIRGLFIVRFNPESVSAIVDSRSNCPPIDILALV